MGNFKRPSLPIVISWVKTARKALDTAIIEKAFKKCSISNNLNGTKDDILSTHTSTRDNTPDRADDTDDEYDTYSSVITEEQAKKL